MSTTKKKPKKNTSTGIDTSKIEILKQGAQTQFWRIIVETMEDSIDDIKDKQDSEGMKDMTPELYKLTNEIFKAKIEMIRQLIKTPDNLIQYFSSPVNEKIDYDPYDKW